MKPKVRQALALATWSFLCVLPVLLKTGPNVVTLTYLAGSKNLWEGLSPYGWAEPGADLFFYPPFFAAFWKAFALLGPKPGILLWAFVNSLAFWWGVSQWFQIQKNQSKWDWFFWIATAVELDISLRYQQANALVAGLLLWSLGALKERRMGLAGFLMALATHVKVFPILMAAVIFLPWDLAFLGSYAASLLVLLGLPALAVGFPEVVWLHWEQFQSTTADFSQRQLLDVAACFKRLGYEGLGKLLQKTTGFIGGLALLGYRIKFSNNQLAWGLWYASFVSLLLAITPKTESPTFVWAAPSYLFLSRALGPRAKWILVGISFCMTLVYSSLFPKAWVSGLTTDYFSKTLANWLLWCLSTLLLVREIVFKKQKGPVH